jgi:AcrR family transcriptional regulator
VAAMAGKQGVRTRRRLTVEERREELLAVGARLFARSPYEDVSIEQVAEIAGVSRGLLYHYFPNKKDFFTAVIEREGRRMLQLTAAVPGASAQEQLAVGLDTFLEYAETHAQGFRAFHRAEAAGDPVVRKVYRKGLAAHERQILDALAADPEVVRLTAHLSESALRIAVRGWMSFMVTVCLEWLDEPSIPREDVRDLCARALLGAIIPP